MKLSIFKKINAFLPFRAALYLDYGRSYHRILNLKNPKFFGEKIHWIKLHGNLERFAPYVDKYEVRSFITDTIGAHYLPQLYAVFNKPKEIELSKLPSSFVLKLNNGTGGNLICRDKSKVNIDKTKNFFNKLMKDKIYRYTKENQYKPVKPKIICEEYLEDETGELRDYKIHCFSGNPEMIEVQTGRFSDHYENYFNTDWIDYGIYGKKVRLGNGLPRPAELEEMLETARTLSKSFPYVRVDLYRANGRVYFGELTFTPANGTDPWFPVEKDLELASKIDHLRYLQL